MTQSELYGHISNRLDISRSLAREFIRELERLTIQELRRVGEFVLPGIIKLVVQKRKVRLGRHPATGVAIKIPAKAVVKARIARELMGHIVPESTVVTRYAFSSRPKGSRRSDSHSSSPTYPLTPKARSRRAHASSKRGTGRLGLVHARRPQKKTKPEEGRIIRVFYGTDREPSATEGHFKSRRAEPGSLSLGWCDVSIPTRHNLGVVEGPSWWLFEFRRYRGKHFVIVGRHAAPPEAFWSSLQQSDHDAALLFIHGFRVSFDDAVYRAAQLSHDLKFRGLTMLYSWSSHGRLLRYAPDGVNNERTIPLLKHFLVNLFDESGASVIHVIAHSMGNRALCQALYELALAAQSARLHNVILAAPDIDSGRFVDIAPNMASLSRRTTLYVSKNDKALKKSMQLHKFPRAGDATNIVIVSGVDTIDASERRTDFLDHSYYGDNTHIVSDIQQMLEHDAPPQKRFGLEGVPVKVPRYWRFLPAR